MEALYIFGAEYLIVVVPIIALFYVWRLPRETQRKLIIFAAIVLPLIFIASRLAGALYDNPRPFVVENFVPLVAHDPDNGFPSDHTLFTGAIAAVVWFFSRRAGTVLFLLAILVGVSRVMAGVHHPIDIIGSLVICCVVAFIVNALSRRKVTAGEGQ